ncbi:Fe-S cluster assembly protein SufD [Halobacillus sp. A1]|uniref:Fe-S cluster assembly protein SufD n=1 Tax=Halobacillus sp. A1 TaxID=2880262 RepID=UPI0020A61F5A|nr:Fe-S cluster assembly protein SufD [Halobacillus sp. A1]MCP3032808.1 Fe-S cluster assembly protein SufD [Halobacillus sp. A1]
MTVKVSLPFDKDYVTQFSQGLNEPDWMKTLRLNAFDKAESLEMPKPDKTNIKDWNFTEFKHHAEGEKIESIHDLPFELLNLLDHEKEQQNLIIQRNHTVAFSSFDKKLEEQGVIFTDIQSAIRNHGDLVEKYYMTDAVHVDEHRLTALHAALMNGGVFVYVPKNVNISEPLQTIFWQEDPEAALINHVLVVAEENSSVTYVENYTSNNKDVKSSANNVTEVIAKAGAKVSFGAVDNFEAGTTVYTNRRGLAERDATIEWALGQMNEGDTVSENITHLLGDNSHSNAKTVAIGRGTQKQNFTANITHFGKGSDGYILQHGVMRDKSSGIFNGIGKIEHGASKSNAEQESRVLMLSKDARGDANPILLIDEDDVTAGHAASVGRVDPMQLYYLMSRGISKFEAERLIIHGFLAPVVNQLPVEAVKQQMKQLIERKVY